MSVKRSHARDPRGVRGRSRRLALPLLLLPALTVLSFASEPGGDTQQVPAGDGRGLATFGNRGLTSFAGRFGESFSQRGLTTFADRPLTPMGGLIPGGQSVPTDGNVVHHHHRCSSSAAAAGLPGPGSDFSEVTLNADAGNAFGNAFVVLDSDGEILMPAVELPSVVLDHRPAAAYMDATLDAAVRAAAESGDLDLARSLDPDRR